jgi:hypothetical protein
MSEAELWQMMLLASENTFGGVGGIATIIFAFLAAAYFVGAKLSWFQGALATVSVYDRRGMLGLLHVSVLQAGYLLHARACGELQHRALCAK